MTDYQTLVVDQDEAVGRIQLNRPKSLNAFNSQMRKELLLALTAMAKDDTIRAVILSSTSAAFSAGADLAEGAPSNMTVEQQVMGEYLPILNQIADMEKPVIAAVPGVMAGVGASIAMQCDLMVMAESATLGVAFSNISLIPDGGACWQLLHKLGYQRAYQLIAEGGRLDAAQCLTFGIANQVVPVEEVNAAATSWAAKLASRAPIALREAKKVLRQTANLSFVETVALEAKVQNYCAATDDAREAVLAFLEKRAPVFTGR
ncbi:enoyl-CoA hydratase/isomerase family protein [Halioxenophilus sp. WMMB6]|uniref:enoyl-CoA hydratase/isomerase family protein n=1 Tax=Halioxenophilus sp. WMMB6 TaxID=3073815 RepID=UPI00295E40F8|nr:enoyl-CoA hydratase-related protein [Halioxenophilus sp. WMMB6]